MEAITQYGQNIEQKIIPIVEDAKKFIIATHDALSIANDKRRGIKGLMKEVIDTFGLIKKKTHEAWKEAVAQEKKYLEPLEAADKILQQNMGNYLMLDEKKRKDEECRLADIAAKERAKELEKAHKKIEALMTKGGDLQAQIDVLQTALNQSATDDEVSFIRSSLDILLAKKVNLAQKVSVQAAQAEQIATEPQRIPSMPEKPKVAGMSYRTEKRREIINKLDVIRAVANNGLPVDLLDVNTTILNRLVKAGMTIPGILIKEVPVTGTR